MDLTVILALPSVCPSEAKALPASPGVYFAVVNGEQLAYVGSTGDLLVRLKNHNKLRALAALGMVRFHYLEADYDVVNNIEQDAIDAFSPCLNQAPAIYGRRSEPGSHLPRALAGRPRGSRNRPSPPA